MGLVALVAIAVISTGFDAGGTTVAVTPYGQVDYQSLSWLSEDVTTNSTSFEPAPNLAFIEVCDPTRAATATVSMTLTGAPAEVRVSLENIRGKSLGTVEPGPAVFDPGSAPAQSFSYVFVRRPSNWPHRAFFSAEWRSPDGNDVTMKSGSIQVLYDREEGSDC
jgi:hypothetical protein